MLPKDKVRLIYFFIYFERFQKVLVLLCRHICQIIRGIRTYIYSINLAFWFSKACTLCTFGFLKPVPPVLMIVFLGGIKYCRGSL